MNSIAMTTNYIHQFSFRLRRINEDYRHTTFINFPMPDQNQAFKNLSLIQSTKFLNLKDKGVTYWYQYVPITTVFANENSIYNLYLGASYKLTKSLRIFLDKTAS